jgi:hypothetical protein
LMMAEEEETARTGRRNRPLRRHYSFFVCFFCWLILFEDFFSAWICFILIFSPLLSRWGLVMAE